MSQQRQGHGASREPVSVQPVPRVGELSVLFLGPYQGLITHWHSGRSWPCAGHDDCPSTIHRARSVWKGYAPVLVWDGPAQLWRPRVLELTEVLEEQLRGRNLAGEVWMLYRAEGGRKSARIEAVYLQRWARADVPQPFDVTPALQRFYHVQQLLLGVPNPLPAKLLLEPCVGPAPKLPEIPASAAESPPTAEQMAKLREMARGAFGPSARSSGKDRSHENGQH